MEDYCATSNEQKRADNFLFENSIHYFVRPRRINRSLGSDEFLSESDRISSDISRKLSDYLWNPADGTDIGS